MDNWARDATPYTNDVPLPVTARISELDASFGLGAEIDREAGRNLEGTPGTRYPPRVRW
jgi:hypothetical protein